MAKAKKEKAKIEIIDKDSLNDIPRLRLSKLIVKNFRCIGSKGVEIDLDEIVVLVGANNVGKSSILRAYELAMCEGSSNAVLKIDDFPNNKIDSSNLPQIELHSIVFDERVGKKWLKETNTPNEWLVIEKWTWSKEGEAPKRIGWNNEIGGWDEIAPFGPANIANQRRPEPHPVYAFDSPEKQALEVKSLLELELKNRVKSLKANKDDDENDYYSLLSKVRELQKKIVIEAKEQIDNINNELTNLVSQVFTGYKIDFDAKPEDDLDKSINLFKADSQLLMGHSDGHLSTIEKQGSGARRTLLWTALKFISENNQKKKDKENAKSRSHLLLIDEPEICLHPNAVRDACNVLYNLPKTNNWQVMVTTHSPIFIDLSKDNTTIIRVEKGDDGEISGTTVFRPDRIKLDDDDKKNLKLLNMCDPYVNEFFFGGKIIIVEGDTEYTAFKYIIETNPDKYKNIHIIRARGKATIVSLIKILNQFGSDYSVLHDADRPKTKKGTSSASWGINTSILNEIGKKTISSKTRLLASISNFEEAYFGESIDSEKPYNALNTIRTDKNKFETIEKLLNALIDFDNHLPEKCVEWKSIEELESLTINN